MSTLSAQNTVLLNYLRMTVSGDDKKLNALQNVHNFANLKEHVTKFNHTVHVTF
jgi:hypothetical protein